MSSIPISRKVVGRERLGWKQDCPICTDEIRYTVLNLRGGLDLFLYCDSSSDFVLLERGTDIFESRDYTKNPTTAELRERHAYLEESLPACPCNGTFSVWSNFKCPHCGYEIPYNRGERNETARFYERKVVWVEGAVLYREEGTPSSLLSRVKVKDE